MIKVVPTIHDTYHLPFICFNLSFCFSFIDVFIFFFLLVLHRRQINPILHKSASKISSKEILIFLVVQDNAFSKQM